MTKGQRIKCRREELNIAQTDLADKIQVSKQTLYKYENDIVTNIPSDKIELLAKELATTPAYIMGWEEPEVTPAVQALLDVYSSQRQDAALLELYHNASEKDQAMVRYILGYKELDGEVPSLKNKKD